MPFSHTIRPRYAEVDQQGVVFNGHWLTYFDDASTRFFEHLGFDPKTTFAGGGAFDVMVVKALLEWRGPTGFDDHVAIAVTPVRLGTSSFELSFSASVSGRLVCDGTITYVSIGTGPAPGPGEAGAKTARPIPQVLRDKLEPLLPRG